MRTLSKTATYFMMHLTVAILLAYALTGDWAVALSIGILEPIVQAVFFAGHERLWEGRRTPQAPRLDALPAALMEQGAGPARAPR